MYNEAGPRRKECAQVDCHEVVPGCGRRDFDQYSRPFSCKSLLDGIENDTAVESTVGERPECGVGFKSVKSRFDPLAFRWLQKGYSIRQPWSPE